MKTITYFLFSLLVLISAGVRAQDEEEKEKPRPQRKAFESAVLIDNQSDVVNSSKTLEWNIQHRFGTVENGSSDLWGMFAASNIRLGFSYTPIDRLAIGFGLSKIAVTNPYIDLNVKYKILQQTRGNEMPVNLTFYGNTAIYTRNESNFDEGVHSLSYFGQLIMSRRISKKFSVQGTVMMSHFNAVDTLLSNDVFGIGLGARFKVSSQGSILLEWTEPLTEHDINNAVHGDLMRRSGPFRNIAIAYEVATSAHAFQITFGIYRDLLQQYNLA
ncbi:MAG: hypothetical protein KAI29_31850, partial [Cyclobacteriaceae bacterium]|nr:hypothetical protein [Cyclobacteriaceae bacterium]